jgi:hypothetical protein
MLVKGNKRLTLPNPHRGDINGSLMKRILKLAEIKPEDWETHA